MNKWTDREKKTWRLYHTPGCSTASPRKINCLFLNPANSLEHEHKKLDVCYEIQKSGAKFITEAVRNRRQPSGKEKRVDVVDLASGLEVEVVHRHESHEDVKAYRAAGVHVVLVNPFVCSVCKLQYPKRRVKNETCDNCKA